MTEKLPWDIQAAIEIGGLFASRWERREQEPVLKEDIAAIILKHLPAVPPGVAQGWMPIESAPKRVKLLAGYFNELGKWRTVTARYIEADMMDDWGEYPEDDNGKPKPGWFEESETHETLMMLDSEPTHWMPLPAAPIPQGEPEGKESGR